MRGTFDPEATYAALDVVAVNGSSFIARRDNPGECPGEGWQLIAATGKRGVAGQKGDAGDRGAKGDPGTSGATIVSWRIDRKHYRAIAKMSDGRELPLELRELFEQFQHDTE